MIAVGDKFPDFTLENQNGETVTLTDCLVADHVVFYFYPKDDTSGCTIEACEFNESLPNFGTVPVIGVSPDNAKSHTKFINKYNLTFTLLADTEHSLAEACGVWVEKSMYGRKYMGIERTTFVVKKDGTVTHVWQKVKPQGHAGEVLAAISQ